MSTETVRAPTATDRRRLTEEIAAYAARTSFDDLTGETRSRATKVVVDTIASMIAGGQSDTADVLRRYASLPGNAGGTGARRPVGAKSGAVSPEAGAFISGTLGHALDYDDVLLTMPGHPSAVVLAAVLFAAPDKRLSGQDALLAYALGVNVASAVGQALGHGHYVRGFHTTATASVFGAAAAAGRRFGLDETQVRLALGIAASTAGGLQRQFGTMTKPFHSGHAARNGLFAAQLAALGFTSNPSVLEAPRGFLEVYGDEHSSPDNAPTLGAPSAFDDPGVALKKYPCCGAIHRAIDAMLDLRSKHDLSGADTESIRCSVPPGALRALLYSNPADGLQAKFSMEYNLAAALVDGSITLASFHDERVSRPEIVELYPKMTIEEVAELSPSSGGVGMDGFIRIQLALRDGRVVAAEVSHPRGSPQRELSWDELRQKFDDCAVEGGFDPEAARFVFDRLRDLAEIDDLRDVLERLQ